MWLAGRNTPDIPSPHVVQMGKKLSKPKLHTGRRMAYKGCWDTVPCVSPALVARGKAGPLEYHWVSPFRTQQVRSGPPERLTELQHHLQERNKTAKCRAAGSLEQASQTESELGINPDAHSAQSARTSAACTLGKLTTKPLTRCKETWPFLE